MDKKNAKYTSKTHFDKREKGVGMGTAAEGRSGGGSSVREEIQLEGSGDGLGVREREREKDGQSEDQCEGDCLEDLARYVHIRTYCTQQILIAQKCLMLF